MIKSLLLVGVGGMIGSVLRYLTVISFRNQAFPYGTLVVNFVGSLVIGIVAGLVTKNTISAELRLFIATGICGGFTTFSAFSAECLQLINQQKIGIAFLYIIISFALGITAAFCGWMLTK
jgi:CrcB protein